MVGLKLRPKKAILHISSNTTGSNLAQSDELKALCQKEEIQLIGAQSKLEITEQVEKYNPSIILIDENLLADKDEEIFCIDNFGIKAYNPFKIILVSAADKAEQEAKTLDLLKRGFDDAIRVDKSAESLFLRCLNYIRRKKNLELNRLTQLPGINRTYEIIDHCRNNLSDWSITHIDISNIKSFNLMYGTQQGDVAIGKTAQILRKACKDKRVEDSFVGHIGRDNFVIISGTDSKQLIIDNIKKLFPDILKKLYKEVDYENGYLVCAAPNHVRRKEDLLSLQLGSCNSIERNFQSGSDIIEQAIVSKRSIRKSNNRDVLIAENDEDFATLISDTLSLEGFNSHISNNKDKLLEEIELVKPRILLLEASVIGKEDFADFCNKIKPYQDEHGLKLLVATNIPGYQNFIAQGADVYIPKPYDLEVLFKEIWRLRDA